ncbi:MAG TPA: aldo/keto reductase [Vicinamibacteria bacterium]
MSERAAKHTNRLVDATSPYLLQHAHNPVDWFPWGEEALARAREEGKPILLSIGYSACHWCHVMERESFEDEAVAELMNRHFVSIKVDREERPDLDDVYMAATLAMNQGQGGWPMTVFLTPDQEPFFAGTYFPPEDRWGRPGFSTVLKRIAELWEKDRESVKEQGAQLAAYLRENAQAAPGGAVGEEALRAAAEQLGGEFDPRGGGFGPAPKFPPSAALSLLLRAHRRFGDERALEMVRKTLDAMARGGMYDQVGGGFARYSTDARWLVPHFEKMLYDNAQLAGVYLEGFQATGEGFYRRIAAETLDYVRREMTDPAGGFYSATDADSEGEEGKFFVWTPAEVGAALGDPELARRFCAYYDITEAGNWEGKSIPNTPRPLDEVARELGVDAAELERSLGDARARVYEARRRRVPPGLDDKVLTAWNGLMISAFAEGFRVLGDEGYLETARRAADFLLGTLRRPDGRLLRTWRAGRAHLDAYLEDYAFFTEALVDLYEAGGTARYLDEAAALAARIREDFAAEEGGFFSTARGHEPLIVRPREGHDGAIPSANAAAAMALARLSYHLDRPDLREDAARAVRAWGKPIGRQPRSFARSLAVVDLLLEGPVELALVGSAGEPGFDALRREIGSRYLPNRIVAHHDPAAGEPRLPLLRGKRLVEGRAALYVCRDYACRQPVTDPAKVSEALAGSRDADPTAAPSSPPALGADRLAGAATAAATSAYARRQRAGEPGYGPLGRTGLVCSRVGFGGYRVDDETPAHREALRRALLSGCNLVDTSTNYTDGGSETLVGEVLADLVRQGRLSREEVIVVSKIGYVQGANLQLAQRREAEGRPFPEVVKYGEGVWHCLHPEFLADQLPRCLARLQVEALDVCLLHNPEYYLSDAQERSEGKLERRREEFYRRLQEAFAWLEGEVAAGRLRGYGVSSNTCTRSADDPEFTSLTRMLGAAEAAGGSGHHFHVLQLPMNLVESGAALEKNNGPDLSRTVLEYAAEHGTGVLVNRPLNAIAGEGMLRLASVSAGAQEIEIEAQFAVVAALEGEFRRDIASRLQTSDASVPPENLFRWSADLQGAAAHVRGLDHWQALESQRILPRLLQVVQVLDQGLTGRIGEAWQAWRSRYLPELQKLLGELRRQAALKSQEATAGIAAVLDPLLPAERREESLSRKALWVVASTPGVSCVLNGMRTAAYVDDALGILSWPPVPDPLAVYEAVREKTAP